MAKRNYSKKFTEPIPSTEVEKISQNSETEISKKVSLNFAITKDDVLHVLQDREIKRIEELLIQAQEDSKRFEEEYSAAKKEIKDIVEKQLGRTVSRVSDKWENNNLFQSDTKEVLIEYFRYAVDHLKNLKNPRVAKVKGDNCKVYRLKTRNKVIAHLNFEIDGFSGTLTQSLFIQDEVALSNLTQKVNDCFYRFHSSKARENELEYQLILTEANTGSVKTAFIQKMMNVANWEDLLEEAKTTKEK